MSSLNKICANTDNYAYAYPVNSVLGYSYIDTSKVVNPKSIKSFKMSGAFITEDSKVVYIKKVIYSDPATIVFWSDNTKTVSKCDPRDDYSETTGLTLCILKKIRSNTRDLLSDWLPTYGNVVTIKDVRKKRNETEE